MFVISFISLFPRRIHRYFHIFSDTWKLYYRFCLLSYPLYVSNLCLYLFSLFTDYFSWVSSFFSSHRWSLLLSTSVLKASKFYITWFCPRSFPFSSTFTLFVFPSANLNPTLPHTFLLFFLMLNILIFFTLPRFSFPWFCLRAFFSILSSFFFLNILLT